MAFKIPATEIAKLLSFKPKAVVKAARAVPSIVKEEIGDIWQWFRRAGHWVVVPTNADAKITGGVAQQATERMPDFAEGYARAGGGLATRRKEGIIALPTKHKAEDPQADLELIRSNLSRVRKMIEEGQLERREVVMPRLGTGQGNLRWAAVRQVIDEVFKDSDIPISVIKVSEDAKKVSIRRPPKSPKPPTPTAAPVREVPPETTPQPSKPRPAAKPEPAAAPALAEDHEFRQALTQAADDLGSFQSRFPHTPLRMEVVERRYPTRQNYLAIKGARRVRVTGEEGAKGFETEVLIPEWDVDVINKRYVPLKFSAGYYTKEGRFLPWPNNELRAQLPRNLEIHSPTTRQFDPVEIPIPDGLTDADITRRLTGEALQHYKAILQIEQGKIEPSLAARQATYIAKLTAGVSRRRADREARMATIYGRLAEDVKSRLKKTYNSLTDLYNDTRYPAILRYMELGRREKMPIHDAERMGKNVIQKILDAAGLRFVEDAGKYRIRPTTGKEVFTRWVGAKADVPELAAAKSPADLLLAMEKAMERVADPRAEVEAALADAPQSVIPLLKSIVIDVPRFEDDFTKSLRLVYDSIAERLHQRLLEVGRIPAKGLRVWMPFYSPQRGYFVADAVLHTLPAAEAARAATPRSQVSLISRVLKKGRWEVDGVEYTPRSSGATIGEIGHTEVVVRPMNQGLIERLGGKRGAVLLNVPDTPTARLTPQREREVLLYRDNAQALIAATKRYIDALVSRYNKESLSKADASSFAKWVAESDRLASDYVSNFLDAALRGERIGTVNYPLGALARARGIAVPDDPVEWLRALHTEARAMGLLEGPPKYLSLPKGKSTLLGVTREAQKPGTMGLNPRPNIREKSYMHGLIEQAASLARDKPPESWTKTEIRRFFDFFLDPHIPKEEFVERGGKVYYTFARDEAGKVLTREPDLPHGISMAKPLGPTGEGPYTPRLKDTIYHKTKMEGVVKDIRAREEAGERFEEIVLHLDDGKEMVYRLSGKDVKSPRRSPLVQVGDRVQKRQAIAAVIREKRVAPAISPQGFIDGMTEFLQFTTKGIVAEAKGMEQEAIQLDRFATVLREYITKSTSPAASALRQAEQYIQLMEERATLLRRRAMSDLSQSQGSAEGRARLREFNDSIREYDVAEGAESLVDYHLPISGDPLPFDFPAVSGAGRDLEEAARIQLVPRVGTLRAGIRSLRNIGAHSFRLPEKVARPIHELHDLYRGGLEFTDNKARLVQNFQKEISEIFGGLGLQRRIRVGKALDGQAINLDQSETAIYYSARTWLNKMANYLNILPSPGERTILNISGEGRTRFDVLDVDITKSTIMLRGLRKVPGLVRRQQRTFTIPLQDVATSYRENYFPHIFQGGWAVYNGDRAILNSGLKLQFFNTVDEALNWVVRNEDWYRDTVGNPTSLGRLYPDSATLRGFLAASDIHIFPRMQIPEGIETYMRKESVGALANKIENAVKTHLKTVGMSSSVIAREDIWKFLRQDSHIRLLPKLRWLGSYKPRMMDIQNYIQDPIEVFEIYSRGAVAKVEGDRWRKQSFDTISSLVKNRANRDDPQTMRAIQYMSEWAARIEAANPTPFEKEMDNVLYYMGGKDAWAMRKGLRLASKVMTNLRLGSPISALVNLSQTVFNTWTVLGKYTFTGIKLVTSARMMKDPKMLKLLDDLGVDLIIQKYALDNFIPRHKGLLDRISLVTLALWNSSERLNRAIAGLGGYAEAIAKKKTHEEAVLYAKHIIDRTQFRYGIEAMPNALATPFRRFLFQFKPYLIHETNFIGDVFSRNVPNRLGTQWGEMARFVTAAAATTGILGLPFIEAIDDVFVRQKNFSFLNYIRDKSPEKISEVPLRGLGALLGVDLSSRIGLGSDIEIIGRFINDPEGVNIGQFFRSLSPWAGLALDAVAAVKDLYFDRSEAGIDRVLQAFIPLQLWYLYYASKQYTGKQWGLFGERSTYVEPGDIRSPKKPQSPILTLPTNRPQPFLIKATGGRPLEEARATESARQAEIMIDQRRRMREKYLMRIRGAELQGKMDEAVRLFNEANEKGLDLSGRDVREQRRQSSRDLYERLWRRLPPRLRDQLKERFESESPDSTLKR